MAGELFNGIPVPLVASVTKTSTLTGATLKNTSTPFPVCQAAAIILDVTAASGTSPTLDVAIETSPDNGTTWYAAYEFTQMTSTGTRRMDIRDIGIGITEVGSEVSIAEVNNPIKANTVLTQDIRIKATIGGTNPSFTFAVWGIFQPLGSQI